MSATWLGVDEFGTDVRKHIRELLKKLLEKFGDNVRA